MFAVEKKMIPGMADVQKLGSLLFQAMRVGRSPDLMFGGGNSQQKDCEFVSQNQILVEFFKSYCWKIVLLFKKTKLTRI